jgi:hypothetical protein
VTTQINDGGQAFPIVRKEFEDGEQIDRIHPGMTIRDYFAGQALCSFMQTPTAQEQLERAIREKVPNGDPEERQRVMAGVLAKRSYLLADAMLRRRAGEPEPGVVQTSGVDRRGDSDPAVAAGHLVSEFNWRIGELFTEWMREHADGRDVSAFAAIVGMSEVEVRQCLLVWSRFSGKRAIYPLLKWTHFCAALTWTDAQKNLQWANDHDATPSEMRAWRRANIGDDRDADSSVAESGP